MEVFATNVGWLLVLVPVLVVGLVGLSLRQVSLRQRRRRSLRRDDSGTYVWIDLDGGERSSCDDPRPGWDASDAAGGGDGDGGGGDGGGGD